LFKEILENIQVKNFEIFSFEPNPTSYNKLKLLDNKNLIINNIAISNFKKKGGGRLFMYMKSTQTVDFI
jgi:hypothetical protein